MSDRTIGERIARALYDGGWLDIHEFEVDNVAWIIDSMLSDEKDDAAPGVERGRRDS